MTLTQQTWRLASAPVNITKSGTNLTSAEAIAAIRAAFSADTDNHWEEAGYSSDAAKGWLMLRRKGAPSGVLGTFRVMIFGGTTAPHANALQGGQVASVGCLYIGVCEDANANSPDADWTLGDPFPGKKWTGGIVVDRSGMSDFMSSSVQCDVLLVSCDRMGGILLRRTLGGFGGYFMVFGEMIEDLNTNTGIWACMGNVSSINDVNNVQGAYVASLPTGFIPKGSYNSTLGQSVGYHNGSGKVAISAMEILTNNANNDQPFLSVAGTGILFPILAKEGSPAANITDWKLRGIFRQLRYGPYATGVKYVKDSSNVVQAIFLCPYFDGSRAGIYLDQNA